MNKILKSLLALTVAVTTIFTSTAFTFESEAASPYNETFAVAASAKINGANSIGYTAALPSIPACDDGMLYLVAMPTYAYSITNECAVVGTAAASVNPTFTVALNHKQATTRLYQKFGLFIKSGGNMTPIAAPQYITNPEVLATHTHARHAYPMKGIQGIDFGNIIFSPEYEAITNPAALYPIVCIVNNGGNQLITNPYSRVTAKDSHPIVHDNYMFNCNDATGVNLFASKCEFYAAGAVLTDDWVIGNEVNERVCNYTVWIGWDEFMRQYEQEFRVAYTAIKSQNANADVYISLDQKWDMSSTDFSFINGKEFVTKFAADMKRNGDIDWAISQHPYTAPLIYAKFWDMSGCPNGNYFKGLVANNRMITFQNLGVMTSYLAQPQFLNTKGQVRPIILSEMGIATAQGGNVQAATLAASYVAATRQPAVRRIIYVNADMGFSATLTPAAVEMYTNIDGANTIAYQQKALATIGASSWEQILR